MSIVVKTNEEEKSNSAILGKLLFSKCKAKSAHLKKKIQYICIQEEEFMQFDELEVLKLS